MGRKVLVAVICWLALGEALGEEEKKVNSSVVNDNESAESAPQLYRNVPAYAPYASGAPHAAYQLRLPVIQAAGSHLTPIKAASVVVPHTAFLNNLKDSYGKYTESPHAAPYKTAFPQQFVQLQELPSHLTQPLVSAAPSVQYKQIPNYFFGPQNFKISGFTANPTPLSHFGGHSHPQLYAENIRTLVPHSNVHSPVYKFSSSPHYGTVVSSFSSPQPQQSSSKAPSTSGHTTPRLQEKPSSQTTSHTNNNSNDNHNHNNNHQQQHQQQYNQQHYQQHQQQQQLSSHEKGQIQAAPAQTSVTAVVNGKTTVINLETKPTVPLLDLNLLEPLTFDNPLVPQVQHFLPKISSATYHKLPTYTAKTPKNKNKEIRVTKTKSYDSGIITDKPHNVVHKKKQNKPTTQSKSAKPTVTVKGNPNGDEFSYEINSPNHKETYNEQVVKYNKETNMKPVEYSYNEQTHKEPEVYTYVHSSKEPLKVTHVEYDSDKDGPKHLVYNLSPEDQEEENEEIRRPSSQESDDSGESSAESEEDGPAPHSYHEESPRNSQKHSEYHESPKYSQNDGHRGHYDAPHKNEHGGSHASVPQPFQHHSYHSSSSKFPPPTQHHHNSQPQQHHEKHHANHHQESPKSYPHLNYHVHHEGTSRPTQYHGEQKTHYNDAPRPSHHLVAEHRGQEYKQAPKQEIRQQVITSSPKYFAQPISVTAEPYQAITHEYEEDIRLLPTHKPHAAPIKVDPNQHVPLGPVTSKPVTYFAYPSPAPQKVHHHHSGGQNQPHSSPAPHVYEQSKRIIIKEQEETPEEMHKHMEQIVTEMTDREENGEEDFENAYKESAFGFPAYEKSSEDIEKDIYDPDSYGSPRFHNTFTPEETPFQQYQQEGDKFPKSARVAYKDARDNNEEDYFLDFSLSQPESFLDRHKSKVDYYKMYKQNRPGKAFYGHDDDENKEKKSEKITVPPSFEGLFGSTTTREQPKQSKLFAQYKAAPIKYEFDYSKEAPRHSTRDSSAYASRPYHKFSRTHFVEPQFQYGFEPITAPLVLDSELAAMASNHSPESEKPNMRKKVYKENWYIKKTSTTGSKPS